jgi:endonuclease/exonuclease/phosphatase family metal-dependent hydrolase
MRKTEPNRSTYSQLRQIPRRSAALHFANHAAALWFAIFHDSIGMLRSSVEIGKTDKSGGAGVPANRARSFLACGLSAFSCAIFLLGPDLKAAETLRVMTFNLWQGGDAGGQPLSQTAAVIRAANVHVVGLQETYGKEKKAVPADNARKLAETLGWNYFDQGERTAIVTSLPIKRHTPRKWGVTVQLPSGKDVAIFNAHLMHAPYQPYQLLKIPYANAPFIQTAAEAVTEARKARGEQIESLLSELKPALAGGEPVFLTGDFNEPSHQDWTARAAAARQCPLAVEFPSTLAIVTAGMRDAFRTVFPDEVSHPGQTWTPTTKVDDPKDRHDRIDFVFVGGAHVIIKQCQIIGENTRVADIVVEPYPSDHRAVVATVVVP